MGFDADANLYAYVGNSPPNWNDPSGTEKLRYCCRDFTVLAVFEMAKALFPQDRECDGTVKHTYGVLGDSR